MELVLFFLCPTILSMGYVCGVPMELVVFSLTLSKGAGIFTSPLLPLQRGNT